MFNISISLSQRRVFMDFNPVVKYSYLKKQNVSQLL
jgi:hypothetical protein